MKKPIGTQRNTWMNEVSEYAENHPEQVIGGVLVTKVVRECLPLIQTEEEYGQTIGQQIDDMLVAAVRNGEELQSFKLEFGEEKWSLFAGRIVKRNA